MTKYSNKFLKDLYRTMLRIRVCEESLVEPINNGDVKCPCHLYSGQEAVAAGVCAALDEKDYIFGNHRSHGHYLAKGGSMQELIAEIYGKETGCSRGRGGSMHLTAMDIGVLGSAPIVAGTISLAVGAALASRIRKEKKVTVSFFGDGSTGEGVLYESLNFSALHKLPIIFVCENNFYSTHLPIRECRPNENISKVGDMFCLTSYRIDGNDVLSVYETSKKAVDLCKQGKGPVFIECTTYRLRGHVGADDNVQGTHTDIRPKAEIEKWKKQDPVKKFEKVLIKNKILTVDDIKDIKQEVEKEVDAAYVFANNSPYPETNQLMEYVYK